MPPALSASTICLGLLRPVGHGRDELEARAALGQFALVSRPSPAGSRSPCWASPARPASRVQRIDDPNPRLGRLRSAHRAGRLPVKTAAVPAQAAHPAARNCRRLSPQVTHPLNMGSIFIGSSSEGKSWETKCNAAARFWNRRGRRVASPIFARPVTLRPNRR